MIIFKIISKFGVFYTYLVKRRSRKVKIESKEKDIVAPRLKPRSQALVIETGVETDKPKRTRTSISKSKTTEPKEFENNSSGDVSVSKKRRNTNRQAPAGEA